jgi:hypothetical protein
MNGRLSTLLFALLLAVSLPAFADSTPANLLSAATRQDSPPLQACPATARGMNFAQIAQTDCCKAHKGICGCRAGKIVCCDNTVSTQPGCTCHGDEGFAE